MSGVKVERRHSEAADLLQRELESGQCMSDEIDLIARSIAEAEQRGRDEERAAVVRWLRDFGAPSYMDSAVLDAADAVERGEHWKRGEP